MYSKKEEKLNIWSHALGFIVFLFFGIEGIFKALKTDFKTGFIIGIYALSLWSLYAASTLYHSAPYPSIKRSRLRIFDHAAIFGLIAGSYTPFCILGIGGSTGSQITLIVWIIALIGIVLKVFFTGKYDKISTAMYLLMGWLIVFYWGDLRDSLTAPARNLLIAGGVLYSIRAILYAIPKLKYNHAIFHVFVFTASMSHFIAVRYYLI